MVMLSASHGLHRMVIILAAYTYFLGSIVFYRRRKKCNTWDDAVKDLNRPSFSNTIHPCNPLNPKELRDLEVGWLYHTPQQSAEIRDKQATLTEEFKTQAHRRKTLLKPIEPLPAPIEIPKDIGHSRINKRSMFVTQLSDPFEDDDYEDNKVTSRKKVTFKPHSAPKKRSSAII